MDTVQEVIDNMRLIIKDKEKPYRYPDKFLVERINEVYKHYAGINETLAEKKTLAGDGTGRYDLDSNLSYLPVDIKRVFVDTTEAGRMRRLQADVLVGTPISSVVTAAAGSVYVWKKVALFNVLTEQTLITGSGELTLAKLDSSQSALPTFSGDVLVQIAGGYQERDVHKTTVESISGGNVTFGLTLDDFGEGESCYFDIIVRQL